MSEIESKSALREMSECIALLMREILCEIVYQRWTSISYEMIGSEHPCRDLMMREVRPDEVVDHVQCDELTLSSSDLKNRARKVLKKIRAARNANTGGADG